MREPGLHFVPILRKHLWFFTLSANLMFYCCYMVLLLVVVNFVYRLNIYFPYKLIINQPCFTQIKCTVCENLSKTYVTVEFSAFCFPFS